MYYIPPLDPFYCATNISHANGIRGLSLLTTTLQLPPGTQTRHCLYKHFFTMLLPTVLNYLSDIFTMPLQTFLNYLSDIFTMLLQTFLNYLPDIFTMPLQTFLTTFQTFLQCFYRHFFYYLSDIFTMLLQTFLNYLFQHCFTMLLHIFLNYLPAIFTILSF